MNKIRIFVLSMLFILLMSCTAMADQAYWNEDYKGARAEWEAFAPNGKYRVQLYKGAIYDQYGQEIKNNKVGSRVETTKTYFNFVNKILGEGAGTYRFLVWDAQNASRSYESEPLQITYDRLQELKNVKDNIIGWQLVDGKWYYYNEDGVMQTGWILVNGKWYYLDGYGVCLLDTVTPDGYRVGPDGAWDWQPANR